MPRILVVGTKSYEFDDEKTGKTIRGSKAYSFGKDNGEIIPVKASFRDVFEAERLFPVPGVYQVDLGFRGNVEYAVLEKELDIDF
ncbi:MAG TPA: hypothetical protein GX708_20595 [Gallicola sp.]|nr:hypothetical protein [Gallicola sp.]